MEFPNILENADQFRKIMQLISIPHSGQSNAQLQQWDLYIVFCHMANLEDKSYNRHRYSSICTSLFFHLRWFLKATKGDFCHIFNFRSNYGSSPIETNGFWNQNIREVIALWINVWISKNGARAHDSQFIIFRWQPGWGREVKWRKGRGTEGPFTVILSNCDCNAVVGTRVLYAKVAVGWKRQNVMAEDHQTRIYLMHIPGNILKWIGGNALFF